MNRVSGAKFQHNLTMPGFPFLFFLSPFSGSIGSVVLILEPDYKL